MLRTILETSDDTTELPLLKTILTTALAETGRTPADIELPTIHKAGVTVTPIKMFELAAPEIMSTLNGALRPGQRNTKFQKSMQRFGLKERFMRRLASSKLKTLKWAGPRLTSGLRETLPTSGHEVPTIANRVRRFFQPQLLVQERFNSRQLLAAHQFHASAAARGNVVKTVGQPLVFDEPHRVTAA